MITEVQPNKMKYKRSVKKEVVVRLGTKMANMIVVIHCHVTRREKKRRSVLIVQLDVGRYLLLLFLGVSEKELPLDCP